MQLSITNHSISCKPPTKSKWGHQRHVRCLRNKWMSRGLVRCEGSRKQIGAHLGQGQSQGWVRIRLRSTDIGLGASRLGRTHLDLHLVQLHQRLELRPTVLVAAAVLALLTVALCCRSCETCHYEA